MLKDFEINKRLTKRNVKRLLERARDVQMIVRSKGFVRSSHPSLVPPTKNNQNSDAIARMVIRIGEAEEECEAINAAIKLMDEESGLIISQKYLSNNSCTDTDLYLNMNISSSSFYSRLDKALLEFAFCYRGGELAEWSDAEVKL